MKNLLELLTPLLKSRKAQKTNMNMTANLEPLSMIAASLPLWFIPPAMGFIPGTLCDDGDPLDILVISPEPIKRATLVEAKPLGYLDMEDEGAKDYKIVAVPNFYTRKYSKLTDLEETFLKISKNFFAHYKDLSMSGEKVKVFDWHSKDAAWEIINESIVK